MSGPLSTNAPFSNFGQTMILRDIEQLYLLVGERNGDMGDAGYGTSSVGQYGPGSDLKGPNKGVKNPSTAGGSIVKYLGTLDVPIFGGAVIAGGNSAGQYAVDWQQYRLSGTQVASGLAATVVGGIGNTASGDYSISGGQTSVASGIDSIAMGNTATASASSAIALGLAAQASGAGSVAIGGKATGSYAVCIASSGRANAQGDRSIIIGGSSGGTVSGSDTTVLNGYISSAISGNGMFVCGPLSGATLPTCDNSFMVALASFTASASLAREILCVSTNTITTSGSGVISNSSVFHGGTLQSRVSTSGSVSKAFALTGRVFNPNSGNTDTVFCFGGDVDCALPVSNIFSANSNLYNASSSSSYVSAIGAKKFASYGVDAAGFSNVVFIGLPNTGGVYSATAGSLVYIGYGTAASYTPAIESTIVAGELGATSKFGCNNKQPQSSVASGGAVTQTAGATYTGNETAMLGSLKTLVNSIRTALVNNGIMS